MKPIQTNKRQYKVFDQTESINQAKKLIEHLKNNQPNMRSIRIDADTIVQIKAERKNVEKIVERIKSKRRVITLEEQIEYGHYA